MQSQNKIDYYFPSIDWLHENKTRFWFEDEPMLTHGLNAFSLILPFTERFIIRTLKQVQPAIKDLSLSDELEKFIIEEQTHSLQHTRFNHSLRQYGYPIDKINQKIERKFKKLTGRFSSLIQLAFCVCFEHYTVSVVKAGLKLDMLKPGVSPIYDLFLWHSYEEIAHKSCVYQVYRHLGGTHRILKFANILATRKILFSLGFATYFRLVGYDVRHKQGISQQHMKNGYWFFFKDPGFISKVLDNYRAIFKPDFSP